MSRAIILDYDNTILDKNTSSNNIEDLKDEQIIQMLKIDDLIVDLLSRLLKDKNNYVAIVTNSKGDWLMNTSQIYLPSLHQFISIYNNHPRYNFQVISARKKYRKILPQAQHKLQCFRDLLTEWSSTHRLLYPKSKHKQHQQRYPIEEIISFGDSNIEAKAAKQVGKERNLTTKIIKFKDDPQTPRAILDQLLLLDIILEPLLEEEKSVKINF